DTKPRVGRLRHERRRGSLRVSTKATGSDYRPDAPLTGTATTHRAEAAKPSVGVMGAGWVGLVTAACFAELGHNVFVRDIDEARIGALREGRVPIHEPGLPDLIHRYKDRLRFTLDANEVFAAAAIVFVCVGTPATYSGDADLSAISRLLKEIPRLSTPLTLVMKSTVPVGT